MREGERSGCVLRAKTLFANFVREFTAHSGLIFVAQSAM
jgi:hypothetical protein